MVHQARIPLPPASALLTVVIPRPLALRLLSGSEVPLRRSGVRPGELPEPVEPEVEPEADDSEDGEEGSGEEDDAAEHNGDGDNGLEALVTLTATVTSPTTSTAAVSAFA